MCVCVCVWGGGGGGGYSSVLVKENLNAWGKMSKTDPLA